LEAKKREIWEATPVIGTPVLQPFGSLGGRGETTKHYHFARGLTTPLGQWPGELDFFVYPSIRS